MTPAPGPKTTDQRQAETIAQAIVDRLVTHDLIDLADEGRELLANRPIDWTKLLDWNRRACDKLIAAHKGKST